MLNDRACPARACLCKQLASVSMEANKQSWLLNELAPIVKLAKHIVFLDAQLDQRVLTVTKATFLD